MLLFLFSKFETILKDEKRERVKKGRKEVDNKVSDLTIPSPPHKKSANWGSPESSS
jgi:hypothetical protein